MNAFILCAGYATRMGALTARQPKSLLPVAGRPILDDLIDRLAGTGRVERAVVVTNDRDHPHFEAWLAARASGPIGLSLLNDGTRTVESRRGAIGDLAFALEATGFGAPLLVAAGDNFFRFDLAAMLERQRATRATTVLLSEEPDPARLRRSGVAEVDFEGRLVRLLEKPEEPASRFCCPPLYVFEEDALAELAPFRRAHPEADAPGHFIAWLAERIVVRTHRMRGARLDVGDRQGYEDAARWLGEHPPG